MCGICLTVDTGRIHALNELRQIHFQNVDGLRMLTESTLGSELITTESYDVIEMAIKDKRYETLQMMNPRNSKKLFELALIKMNMWDGRNVLNVRILPHSFNQDLNMQIEQFANEWAPYSGIQFNFINAGQAEIIIQLNANGIHSSQIGKNALPFSRRGEITMHLGIGAAHNLEHIRRPVIHEFGHALGCIHEHQSPAADIQWNEPIVIRSHSLGGWDEATVRHNVFFKYTQSEITNSEFDPNSIMIYPIPADFTTNGYNVGWNTQLSDTDRAFMRRAYSVS